MAEANVECVPLKDHKALWVKVTTRIAWFVAIFTACGFIYSQITRDDVLPVKEIVVSGVFSQLKTDELKALVADGVEGNFFTLSVAVLYTKLLSMPWIEQVWIHRVWPDKIKINILEQKPIAIWDEKGLINAKGELFYDDASAYKDSLPRFVVDARYKQEVIKWNGEYKKILDEFGLSIKRFELDDRKNQSIYLSNKIKLDLGGAETAQRLTRFLKVFKNNLYREEGRISKVDLRYSNGFSVAWKQ